MLLDTVHFKDQRMTPLKGIVDFSNKKFIHFFDFSETNDANLVMIAIHWRTHRPDMRFSVFCSLYFPHLRLPPIKIINKRHAYVNTKSKHKQKRPTDIKKTRFSTANPVEEKG